MMKEVGIWIKSMIAIGKIRLGVDMFRMTQVLNVTNDYVDPLEYRDWIIEVSRAFDEAMEMI